MMANNDVIYVKKLKTDFIRLSEPDNNIYKFIRMEHDIIMKYEYI